MAENLLKLICSRRSIRSFSEEPVPDEVVYQLLESARWAPSPSNRQNYFLMAIRRRELITDMSRVVREKIETIEGLLPQEDAVDSFREYSRYFTTFEGAPLVIAVAYRPNSPLLKTFLGSSFQDDDNIGEISAAAAATQNILLVAHQLGYGSCWMTGPLIAGKELSALIGLQKNYRLAALIPIGRAAEAPNPPKRKDINKIIRVVD